MSRLSGLRKDIVPDNAGTQWLSYSQSVSQQNLFFSKPHFVGPFMCEDISLISDTNIFR